MTHPHARALAIHSVLEDVFSDPRTWGYFGNHATAEPKTIGTAKPQSRGPVSPKTFCLSEDECFVINGSRPAPDVEILAGRAE